MCICLWRQEVIHNIVVLFACPVWNNILNSFWIPKVKWAFSREEILFDCCCWEAVSKRKHSYSIEALRGFYSTSKSIIYPAGVHRAIGRFYCVKKRVVLHTEVTQFVFVSVCQSFSQVWDLKTGSILNIFNSQWVNSAVDGFECGTCLVMLKHPSYAFSVSIHRQPKKQDVNAWRNACSPSQSWATGIGTRGKRAVPTPPPSPRAFFLFFLLSLLLFLLSAMGW